MGMSVSSKFHFHFTRYDSLGNNATKLSIENDLIKKSSINREKVKKFYCLSKWPISPSTHLIRATQWYVVFV